MLEEKLELVLKELSMENYNTATDISHKLDLSEKTIRVRIKELKEVLKLNGAEIESKQGFGYRLKIEDKELFDNFILKKLKGEREHLPTTSKERVSYILDLLLENNNYIKLDELSEFLFVSRNTLTADLKKVECIINSFDLKIARRPNYGIMIQGDELILYN